VPIRIVCTIVCTFVNGFLVALGFKRNKNRAQAPGERARAARLTATAAGVKARLGGRSRFGVAKARPWAEREGHGPMAAA